MCMQHECHHVRHDDKGQDDIDDGPDDPYFTNAAQKDHRRRGEHVALFILIVCQVGNARAGVVAIAKNSAKDKQYSADGDDGHAGMEEIELKRGSDHADS